MTDGRRQTRQQAFFLRVIDSSTARIKERLADGDVIVVEVIGGPLLARGLLGVFDMNLRDEVVVGLITCGGVLFGQVASSSAKVRGLDIHEIKEVESVKQHEEQEDKRDEEIGEEVNGEVESIRETHNEMTRVLQNLPRVEYLKVWPMSSSDRTRRFEIIH